MPEYGYGTSHDCPDVGHCVAKIREIVAAGRDDRRAVLQLGYNLGRLSELTGLGREPFWDAWKDAVAAWETDRLRTLAQDLLIQINGRRPDEGAAPVAAESTPS
jgi:hypothetical protein